jgi:2-polyprenyl-3-methyl-5-hydroxy-6-metoxy-1,4-benzoquinol methylase
MVTFQDIPITAVQQYWDARPCNIRHSPAEVGTREYFDQVEARKYFVEPHIPRFAEFERWRGRKVLDVGCGIGTDTMNFARAGASVTAVDLSSASLQLAQQRARVYGLDDRVRFYAANAEQLSDVVPVEPYDLVYSFGVLHHTPHPRQAFKQIREHYLADGGTFKLMVYNRLSWKVLWVLATYGKGAFWNLDKIVARHSEAQTGCPVTYTYSPDQIRRQLGPRFVVEDVSIEHIFPYQIPEYTRYEYVKTWYFRYLPEPVFRALEHRLGWHLCVTARAR